MTQLEILNLAWSTQLQKWANENNRKEANDDNPITNAREEREWNKLKELERMIKEEERKEK